MSRQYLLLLPFVLSSAVGQAQEAATDSAPAVAQPQAKSAKQYTVKISVRREAEFEELLRTAEVVSIGDIVVGVTKPSSAILKKGDI